MKENSNITQNTTVVIPHHKSMGVALVLAFFFGPLGLLYSSVAGGIIMLIFSFIIGIVTFGFGLILGWIGSLIWAAVAVNRYNARMPKSFNPPVSNP